MSLLLSTWNKYYVSIEKMKELKKKSRDRTSLRFSNNESTSKISTQPPLNMFKGNYIHFVKSSTLYEHNEPKVQFEQPINQRIKERILRLVMSSLIGMSAEKYI